MVFEGFKKFFISKYFMISVVQNDQDEKSWRERTKGRKAERRG